MGRFSATGLSAVIPATVYDVCELTYGLLNSAVAIWCKGVQFPERAFSRASRTVRSACWFRSAAFIIVANALNWQAGRQAAGEFLVVRSATLTAVSTLNCELRLSMSATLIEAMTLNCAFLVVMSAILTAVSTLNCEFRLSRSATLIKASELNCAFLVVMSAILTAVRH